MKIIFMYFFYLKINYFKKNKKNADYLRKIINIFI